MLLAVFGSRIEDSLLALQDIQAELQTQNVLSSRRKNLIFMLKSQDQPTSVLYWTASIFREQNTVASLLFQLHPRLFDCRYDGNIH